MPLFFTCLFPSSHNLGSKQSVSVLIPFANMLRHKNVDLFPSACPPLNDLFFFNYSCTCMLTFKKLFLFLFFPLPWKLSFDSQAVLPAFLWLFTFCPLKRRPLWCVLGILAVQVQKKALLSNLFWHLCILAQSSAGLMGWLQMALSFSHCSPLCMRGTFCLFMWETLFFLGTIHLNLETSVILLNVWMSHF